ncbi:hypothetical protein [Lunatimonas salinarum]|nr:hypothetical protein [Lunatimonas salinarum]
MAGKSDDISKFISQGTGVENINQTSDISEQLLWNENPMNSAFNMDFKY